MGADGGAMVSRGVRWTSHTEVLTTLRLVETTRTLHAFMSISGEVLARPARLWPLHNNNNNEINSPFNFYIKRNLQTKLPQLSFTIVVR